MVALSQPTLQSFPGPSTCKPWLPGRCCKVTKLGSFVQTLFLSEVFCSGVWAEICWYLQHKRCCVFLLLAGPKVSIFLAIADILICFAMRSPSVIQKSLPSLQVKNRILSCGRTVLSSILLLSSQRKIVGDISESRLGTVLLDSFRIIKVGKDLLRSSSPISERDSC